MKPYVVYIISTIFTVLPIFAASGAQAATTRTENYSTYYTVISSSTMTLAADHTYTTQEIAGISRNDSGGQMFNKMTARCLGTSEVIAGASVSRGSCVEMYQDGSQTFTTYESKRPSGASMSTGVHTYVGGTGKYAGISGTAPYSVEGLKTPENVRAFIARHRATYTLP